MARRPRALRLLIGATLLAISPALLAWTPKSQVSIAEQAARLSPPDLYRQILRRKAAFRDGVMAPFRDRDGDRHQHNPGGQGSLHEVIQEEVKYAVVAIASHRTFDDVVYQLGVVSHYLADANNPLNTSARDAHEPQYFADYLRYMETAEPRFKVVFYGLDSGLEDRGDVAHFVGQTLGRARSLYPFIGLEYRRTGRLPGLRHFDDRSTAFAVASVSYSRAVSDVAQVLRYIWIKAGGADQRVAPRAEEGRLLVVDLSQVGH